MSVIMIASATPVMITCIAAEAPCGARLRTWPLDCWINSVQVALADWYWTSARSCFLVTGNVSADGSSVCSIQMALIVTHAELSASTLTTAIKATRVRRMVNIMAWTGVTLLTELVLIWQIIRRSGVEDREEAEDLQP